MWDFHNLALVTNAAAEFADFLLDERLFENFDHCAFNVFRCILQPKFGSKQLFLGLSSQAKKLFFAFLNHFNNEIRLCLDRIKLNN